jgi:bisphosphoglycerate-dependent phosphoglycerate mutase
MLLFGCHGPGCLSFILGTQRYTLQHSRLKRAIRSTWILRHQLNQIHVPVLKGWRINKRRYGSLTGLSKKYGSLTGLSKTQTAERLGVDLVQEWRGSLRSLPPPMTEDHPFYPGRERKYADLTKEQIPLTESLLDCMDRTIPLWENKIMYELMEGRNVQMVKQGHGETQFMAWRRGYNVKPPPEPPPVSSFSPLYPGNDQIYHKYLRDVRYSLRESVIRSIKKGKIILQRKLPKTKSLKVCMDRTIPLLCRKDRQRCCRSREACSDLQQRECYSRIAHAAL